MKNVAYWFSLDLWVSNVTEKVTYDTKLHVQQQSHISLLPGGYVRSRDKWTSTDIYFYEAYCH